jgi:hypothetical protein
MEKAEFSEEKFLGSFDKDRFSTGMRSKNI